MGGWNWTLLKLLERDDSALLHRKLQFCLLYVIATVLVVSATDEVAL